MELQIAKEEMEKLNEDAKAYKEHMLQVVILLI